MNDRLIILAAALAAIAIPVLLLWPHDSTRAPGARATATPQAAPDRVASGERRLFTDDGGEASPPPGDAPDLAGIVGRLPHDAVALIRAEGGGTKMLAPGQSYRGWRLEALSAEAALFSHGPRRVRVPLPASDPAEMSVGQ